MIVGFVCNPKNESRIEVPLDPVAALVIGGREGLTPDLSLFAPDTDDLTAAKTTLAKDIPDVLPRYLESEAPWTEKLPMFETSLLSLSDSSCFLFHATSSLDCLLLEVMDVLFPFNIGAPSSLGVSAALGSVPGREECSRTSAGANGMLLSRRTCSR